MGLLELFIVAIGVSMDAFAVAICKGLSMKNIDFRKIGTVGLYFGIFQGIMPLIGYGLGTRFNNGIEFIDHWVAFALLGIIGINMIWESKKCDCEDEGIDESLGFKNMIILSLATSIDALAVGVTFAFLDVNIILAVIFIGIITLIFSSLGVKIGHVFGKTCKSKAELVGGGILILMGLKILLSHLQIISF